MLPSLPPSRREFLGLSALALATATLSRAQVQQTPPPPASPPRRTLLGFSKPFIHLSPDESADLVAEVGWDGIECPIRANSTHVNPARVEEDLPRLLEAMRRRGKSIEVVTTDIVRVDARAEKILRTVAKLGIKTYRIGFMRYPAGKSPAEGLREFAAAVRDLSALNRELGLQGGYQNHSGPDYIGGTLWELWHAFAELDPTTVGVCFDIGQAMVEGGLSWPTQARLLQSRWLTFQVKDFLWEKPAGKAWDVRWCALGEGRVTQAVLDTVKAAAFAGPVIQHHEHLRPGLPRQELLPALKQELTTLRTWLR